jgi:hypothetical protein
MKGWINDKGEYCLECPWCGKIICSKYIKQALFNMETHIQHCKKRAKAMVNV